MSNHVSSSTAPVAPFMLYPVPCTPEFRDAVKQMFPALTTHPEAPLLWKMLQYFLYAPHWDEAGERILCHYKTLAECADKHPHHGKFRAK